MGGQKIYYKQGYRVNLLEVIEKSNKRNKNGDILWKCYCHGCNNFCLIPSNQLNIKNKRVAYSCGCYKRGELLPGEKYNELEVVSKTNKKNHSGEKLYLFNCSCGKKNIELSGVRVKNSSIKSCGHLKNPDYTGYHFGELLVLSKTEKRSANHGVIYLCQCSCGKKIEVPIGDLKKGQLSCGHLQNSKGEIVIQKILTALNIQFEMQKSFCDCINNKTHYHLRFDFYLPDYNTCIEYDGEQHFYNKESGWNNKKHLDDTQYRDNIKDNYCKQNNIKLIRIPYWDYSRIDNIYIEKALHCPLMNVSKIFK